MKVPPVQTCAMDSVSIYCPKFW